MENRNKKIQEQLEKVGPDQTDGDGRIYNMINGKIVYQLTIRSENDRKLQRNISAYRASGFSSPSEWLKNLYS